MHIYIVGICGTGTGALAGLLKDLGHDVSGSDAHVYPPMSDKLAAWGIGVNEGFVAAHLVPRPDLVIVGNVIRADNPEAEAARAGGLPTMSMPQAVAQFGIGDKHSVVVAGTHGKTTTTALIAHVLVHAGRDPSFLVGGAMVGYAAQYRAGQGDTFVVEGDEYDTAYFDKGPKFLHYRARTAIITSLEFDHADIFADIAAVERAFAGLLQMLPPDAHLIVWHGAARARALMAALCPKVARTVYASARPADDAAELVAENVRYDEEGIAFEAVWRGRDLGRMRVPIWGDMGVCNALAAIAAACGRGLDADSIRAGLASFAGVHRRMEVVAEVGGVTVVDDFAHHPTAVATTLAAARSRWSGRRLWALFEPRSATSRRNVFAADYVQAFAAADVVIIAGHARLQEVAPAQRFDPDALAQQLGKRGVHAQFVAQPNDIVDMVARRASPGDVILMLSNGDFGGMRGLLPQALQGILLNRSVKSTTPLNDLQKR